MSTPSRVLAVLLATLLLGTAVWVPVPAAAAGTPTASFGSDVTTVTRGDVVEITVSHSAPGVLNVGGHGYGYHLAVDLPGSGTTTVTIDTYNSTGAPETYVSGGGNKTLSTAPLRRPLEPTTYVMNVTIDGVERALGQLDVRPRANTTATTLVAPASVGDADLDAATLRGATTRRTTVAKGDLAVFRLNESGLSSALNPDDVTGDAAANGIRLSLNQLEVKQNRDQRSFLATPENGTTVVPDLGNDVVYVVWNTSALPVEGDEERYELAMTLVGDHNAFVDEDRITARTPLTLVEPRVSMRVDDETVYPWETLDVNVSGETNLAPGTELELRARAPGKPFLRLVPVTVQADGSFNESLAFAPDDRGLVFPLWIRDHRDATEKTIRLLASNASLRFVDQQTDGTYVTINRVDVSVGGFVTVETAAEERLGTSAYLPAGTHRNVVVEFDRPLRAGGTLLAIAHADVDRNRNFSAATDAPFRVNGTNGSVVADDARVGLDPSARTPTAIAATTGTTGTTTVRPTAAATPTPYPVTERTPLRPSSAPTHAGLPFSPALAVLALLLVGVLARRRR